MKIDLHTVICALMLCISIMMLLVPLLAGFGKLTASQAATVAVFGMLSAFMLGKHIGEARHG